jgi:hypothetical protein
MPKKILLRPKFVPNPRPIKILKRYTDIAALVDILTNKHIVLLNPESWDDSNDSYYLSTYKKIKNLRTVLALCFTEAPETYHHWRVFASTPGGVCIDFDRIELIEAINACPGASHAPVVYKTLADARSANPQTEELPFLKRKAFENEIEYRFIYESDDKMENSKTVAITLDCIRRINLSPWMHVDLSKSMSQLLHRIDGCDSIAISKSTLIKNDVWRKRADSLLVGEN